MNIREQKKFTLDPRTKLLLIVLGNILMYSFGDNLYLYLLTIFALLITMLLGKIKAAFQMGGCFILLYVSTYLVQFAPKWFSSFWGMAVLPFILFMPLFALAFLLFATTEISEMITALQKMKIPQNITTPLIVMFRFFPTIRIELKGIRDAMK